MRVGLELELLAPPGSTRDTLARAFARHVGGRVEYGFKFHGHGHLATSEGPRPDCRLTDAVRVMVGRRWVASVVDDPTILDDLDAHAAERPTLRTDDVRLALLLERQGWHRTSSRRLEAVRALFADSFSQPHHVLDGLGHPVVVPATESTERARVCEVVLAPLTRPALKKQLTLVCSLATKLGFTVPSEGATHAHYDAAPFRNTRLLSRLVLEWTARREELVKTLEPNPRCRKLGPFASDVLRVAKEAKRSLSFDTFASALLLAGLRREVDLNVLGVVERFPKQPTVEVRCLPSTLDANATLRRLAHVDDFLARVLSN